MNKQGAGKIGWTDYTWSPVTGCKHGCSYCYANRIGQRIYPEKFEPIFRPERLKDKDLGKVKPGSKIFTCDMSDLFGSWVPKEWVEQILSVVKSHPDLTFQFLTKNPRRYEEFAFPSNCWLGTTWDGLPLTQANIDWLSDVETDCIKYVSFEPLLGPGPSDLPVDQIDWIIVGELTGAPMTQEKVHEVSGWAHDLIDLADEYSIPVFVKNALAAIYPQREFPI